MSTLTLSEIGLRYPNGLIGLHEVGLDVADGEFIALVGPSGSGKTTLLRTVAGFLTPSRGEIRIDGELVASASGGLPPERRRLGMVFQQHAVWPHWDVARNVGYPLKLAHVPGRERDRRVGEVLDLVGLSGYDRRMPSTLSGGQRQRVALARALVASPRILLLDEALSALDEPLRDTMRRELSSLTASIGLTVIHVTHDREEALALADRVVVLDGGRIQQVDPPDRVLASPASPFVAAFLGDATIVDGAVRGGEFVARNHKLTLPAAILDGAVDGASGWLAVHPDAVSVTRWDGTREPGARAEVVSSLYGRLANDLVVRWRGIDLRAQVTGWRPRVGDAVAVSAAHATFYAEPDPLPAPEPAAAQPATTQPARTPANR